MQFLRLPQITLFWTQTTRATQLFTTVLIFGGLQKQVKLCVGHMVA